MTKSLTVLALIAGLVLAGCGGGDDDTSPETDAGTTEPAATATTAEQAAPKPTGTTIVASGSQFGDVLYDSKDQAVYFFDKETGPDAQCYGACAEAWPPVLTEGPPKAGSGAIQKLLGTTERNDGTTQVTYAGRPLYYYAHEGPGEVTCHNVDEFGGLWLAVSPSGDHIS